MLALSVPLVIFHFKLLLLLFEPHETNFRILTSSYVPLFVSQCYLLFPDMPEGALVRDTMPDYVQPIPRFLPILSSLISFTLSIVISFKNRPRFVLTKRESSVQ
jgi:hypothetical protein